MEMPNTASRSGHSGGDRQWHKNGSMFPVAGGQKNLLQPQRIGLRDSN